MMAQVSLAVVVVGVGVGDRHHAACTVVRRRTTDTWTTLALGGKG